jgi:hypothetical protein
LIELYTEHREGVIYRLKQAERHTFSLVEVFLKGERNLIIKFREIIAFHDTEANPQNCAQTAAKFE